MLFYKLLTVVRLVVGTVHLAIIRLCTSIGYINHQSTLSSGDSYVIILLQYIWPAATYDCTSIGYILDVAVVQRHYVSEYTAKSSNVLGI